MELARWRWNHWLHHLLKNIQRKTSNQQSRVFSRSTNFSRHPTNSKHLHWTSHHKKQKEILQLLQAIFHSNHKMKFLVMILSRLFAKLKKNLYLLSLDLMTRNSLLVKYSMFPEASGRKSNMLLNPGQSSQQCLFLNLEYSYLVGNK